jgi:hypothetical protein
MWEEGCASGLAKYNRRQELRYDDLFLKMGVVLCFNTMSIALRQKLKKRKSCSWRKLQRRCDPWSIAPSTWEIPAKFAVLQRGQRFIVCVMTAVSLRLQPWVNDWTKDSNHCVKVLPRGHISPSSFVKSSIVKTCCQDACHSSGQRWC